MKSISSIYLKILLITIMGIFSLYHQAHAEEIDYSADGERRAKSAG